MSEELDIASVEVSSTVGEMVKDRCAHLYYQSKQEHRTAIAFGMPPRYVLSFRAIFFERLREFPATIKYLGLPIYCVPGQPIHLIYAADEAARMTYEENQQKEPEAR